MKEYISILKKNRLFNGVKEAEIEGIISSSSRSIKKYEKGDFIIMSGLPVSNIGLVLEGGVDVIKEDLRGIRSIVGKFKQGEMFAEALACAEVESSPVSVSAAQRSVILFLNFKKLISTDCNVDNVNIKLINNMLKILAGKNIYLNSKLEHISKRTIREKLLSYFAAQKTRAGSNSFLLPMSKTDLADFLFIDRSAMARELTLMKKENIVDFKGREIVLK